MGPITRHRRFKPYSDTTDYEPFPENNYRPPIHVTDRRVEEQVGVDDGEPADDRVIFREQANGLSGLANQIHSHEGNFMTCFRFS